MGCQDARLWIQRSLFASGLAVFLFLTGTYIYRSYLMLHEQLAGFLLTPCEHSDDRVHACRYVDVCLSNQFYILYIASSVGAQSGSCPVFGTDQSSSLTRSREERIFLNFEAPSQCRGNVTSWSFCHYRSTTGDDDEEEDNEQYGAKFVVYRRATPTSDIYEPVAGSVKSELLRYRDVGANFRCRTSTVTATEIQENDIVGACVWDRGNVNPLYLIGTGVTNGNLQKLYQYDRSDYDDCTETQLGSVDTANSNFQLRNEWKLHLYANIGMN